MLPRWLAILVVYVLFFAVLRFLVLQVIPPIIREFEQLGSKVPAYVKDFRQWAKDNQEFARLNHKYDITRPSPSRRRRCPRSWATRRAPSGDHRRAAQQPAGGDHVLALAFFLLLDGVEFERMTSRMAETYRAACAGSATRIAGIVKSYVSVNLLLAVPAGVFTWLVLELLGVDLAVTTGR